MNLKDAVDRASGAVGKAVFYLRENGPQVSQAVQFGMKVGRMIEGMGDPVQYLKREVPKLVVDVIEGRIKVVRVSEEEIRRERERQQARGGWRPPADR